MLKVEISHVRAINGMSLYLHYTVQISLTVMKKKLS